MTQNTTQHLAVTDAEIAQLQEQQADTTELCSRLLAGKWDAATYGADSAEAVLYAIDPSKYQAYKDGAFSVAPFG